jgi:hypothetical protein
VGYVFYYPANLPVTDVTGEAPAAKRWRFKLLEICHAVSATVLFQNFWSEKYIFYRCTVHLDNFRILFTKKITFY